MRIAFFFLFRDGDGYIAIIFDDMSQSLKARLEPGHAYRRWAHIHAAPRLAEVKGNANDANFSGNDIGVGSSCGRHIFLSTAEFAENAESGNSFTIRLRPSFSSGTSRASSFLPPSTPRSPSQEVIYDSFETIL